MRICGKLYETAMTKVYPEVIAVVLGEAMFVRVV